MLLPAAINRIGYNYIFLSRCLSRMNIELLEASNMSGVVARNLSSL